MVAVGLHQAIEGAAIAQGKIAAHLQIKEAIIGKKRARLADEQHSVCCRHQRKKNIQPQRFSLSLIAAACLGFYLCHGKGRLNDLSMALPVEGQYKAYPGKWLVWPGREWPSRFWQNRQQSG
jgi:hypothetical protein